MAKLTDEEKENLVAYLDGELDEETARTLEARLNLDPQARAEAESLKQAWGMLDYLPRAEPNQSFTHRTLERLAVQTSQLRRRAWPRWLWGLTWAASLLLAVAAGYFGARLFYPRNPEPPDVDEQMVRNLPILERVYQYDQVEEIDFLKGLNQPELFGDDFGS